MNLFTIEDYKVLLEDVPLLNFTHDLSIIIKDNNFKTTNADEDIRDFLIKKYPSTSKFFFELPLRQVPRFINNEDKFIHSIVLWRLKIGK